MTELTGLVLAGGRSTRMGTDKATLTVNGERLVDRAVRVLATCCVDVLVAPGPDRALSVDGAAVVADASGAGPLAGIVAGLQQAATPLVAVVAVDMPHASAAVMRALAGVWDGEAAVVPVVRGRVQPLHAVYAVAWAERYAALLAGGERSVRRALQVLDARTVDAAVWAAADPTGGFAVNLNTPADIADFSGR